MSATKSVTDLRASVEVVGAPWQESSYYSSAENWTFVFWDQGTVFRRLFDQLDLTSIIELACGHGRHAEQVVGRAGKMVLMDIFDTNLDKCRERLAGHQAISYVKGDGFTFRPVSDGSVTAIYCYDAMVHFSPDLVQSYLDDAYRVLTPGGKLLFHHSNYPAPLNIHYGQNPHARNHMTRELFGTFAIEAGLTVIESVVIPWGGIADLDSVTLCRK
jgi:ubiquinone/menaquinone biosynthesis C-methylase UbiE